MFFRPINLFLVLGLVASQDNFVCENPSSTTGGFDLTEAVRGLEWCYDSDPVPFEIFMPSPLSLQTQTEIAITFDAGYGSYIYGNGIYNGNIFVYEKNCRKNKGKKQDGRKAKKAKKTSKELSDMTADHCYSSNKDYGCVLVDAPTSFGDGFGSWVKSFCESKGADLEVMIISHEHFDHMGNGNSILEANPTLHTIIASADVAAEIESWMTIQYENPTVHEILAPKDYFPAYVITHRVEGTEYLEIGNQTIEARAGSGHTPGNLILFHSPSKVLTSIDGIVFPKWAPFFDFALGSNVPMLYKQFDLYREYDYEYFVGGHLTHIGTPEDVAVSEEFAIDLLSAANAALNGIATDPSSSASFGFILPRINLAAPPNAGNLWLLMREYLNQVALFCADIVLDETKNLSGKKWIEVLGSVRATVFSHCRTLADALRVELPGSP